jgi:hypothetical protein
MNRFQSPVTLFLIAMGIFVSTARPSPAATIGDPQHPAELPAALADAYRNGNRDITIAPGSYDLPTTGKDTIALDHWSDAKVHAANVTLIFQDLSHRPIHFIHCANVTFEGATLRLAVPAATQGRVKAIGSDEKGPYCDWQIDTGYSDKINPVKSMIDVVDQHSKKLKKQTGDFSPASSEPLGSGLFRLRFKRDMPRFEAGDWLITRIDAGSVICHVDGCENVTLSGLVMQNGGFGTFFETGGAGGNHYLRCRITCGPRPAGATEDEVVSCGADGFHSVETTRGPDIEDCDFDGVYHDDCIAIHGSFQKVLSSSGTTLVLDRHADQYAPNEPIRISDGKGFFEQATCVAVNEPQGKGKPFEITLDRPLEVPVGAKANNPNHCGRGFKILRCRLGNTRSRGILVKADDGLIDGCTIEGCGMSAISIGPEYYWGEANYCWNVTVSNNVIRNCVKRNGDDGSIFVHGDGAIGNRHIIIRDNLLDADYGESIMKLEWADGLDVTGNRVVRPFELPLGKPGHVFELAHDRDVKLAGNTVEQAGPAAGSTVGIGEDVSGVQNADVAGGEKK